MSGMPKVLILQLPKWMNEELASSYFSIFKQLGYDLLPNERVEGRMDTKKYIEALIERRKDRESMVLYWSYREDLSDLPMELVQMGTVISLVPMSGIEWMKMRKIIEEDDEEVVS